ncbi:MAG TPA: GNAT family N-acetyltransferase [Pyrinomonadaceae bacterium]|jgi:GNAT superfamily N-acetyltransferase|nr:GNAT family N-acetyltransferase [Pyrinomonadaceae bacterium]
MNITFRQAALDDLPAIVRMLADDFLGATRENPAEPLEESYLKAFKEIDASDSNELIVVESGSAKGASGIIVGTMQLTFIPGISRLGAKRLLIEAVRVDSKLRGAGIGKKMVQWAIERAKTAGCQSVQLTSDNARKDAHRFYENLGFKGSHLGMKLSLD